MQLAHSTTLKWSPASHMSTDGYDDARRENSQRCPKSTQGAIANEVKIERIGPPHMRVTQYAERVTTRHSRCNDVEIERIRTCHMTPMQNSLQRSISNNASFRLKHPAVPDGSDGADGTSYPLRGNFTLPVTQATGRVAYLPPLVRGWYTHHQNNTCVTLFPGAAVIL